jgi:hypothetical protein
VAEPAPAEVVLETAVEPPPPAEPSVFSEPMEPADLSEPAELPETIDLSEPSEPLA